MSGDQPAGPQRDGMAIVALPYLASLFTAMADGVIVTDPEFRVTAWNPAAEQLYGYAAEEMLGRSTREVLESEDEPAPDRIVADLLRTGSVRFELAARRKDGTTVDVDVTGTAVRDVSGALVGYLGVHRDITERNRVEGEYRRLSAIVEHSADMIGMLDLDGRPLFLNEAGQRLVGLRGMDQVLEAHLLDFYAPEDRDRVRNEVMPTILAQGRGAWELELRHFETGERITVSLDAFRLDDPVTGEPMAMAAIGRDVSAHRRAEAELLDYQRRIDTILEGVTDAFYFLDGEFRFAYLNAQAVRVLGDLLGRRVVAADVLGNDMFEMLPGLAGGRLERTLRQATADQRSLSCDHMYPPDGPWFEVRVYPSADGLAVSFREISERKEAEKARERHGHRAEAVADLGLRAVRGKDLAQLMEEAAATAARTLDAGLAAVATFDAHEGGVMLRAGVGWAPGSVGTGEPAIGSALADALRRDDALVVEDLAHEADGPIPKLLTDHGVRSAALVTVAGHREPFGMLGVFARERRRFDAEEVNFLRAIANVLYSAIERDGLERRVRDVRDDERRRIARALHDETLQDLGAALVAAGRTPGARSGTDEDLTPRLQRVGEQLRAAIHDLRLGHERDGPIDVMVEDLVAVHRSLLPGVELTVHIEELPDRLPADMAGHVLGVLGEALTNVRRHAGAQHISVRVAIVGGTLVASVTDDGAGFADGRVPGALGGHGVLGMRERAELLGGELIVAPGPDGGTVVELRAPVWELPAPGDRARVLLVDDHAAVREALALAFADSNGFTVCGQAATLAEARTMLEGVDIAIIDLKLPDGSGADLIPALRAVSPQAQALVLTALADRESTARAVERGAAAVLSKATHLHEVVATVRRLQEGKTVMPLEQVVDLLRFAGQTRERELDERRLIETLTPREREVLQLLAEGVDGRHMAARLHISPRTQRNHMANILTKLDVHSQLQALLFALRHGAVDVRRGAGGMH